MLKRILIGISLIILGGIAGTALGFSLYPYIPQWHKSTIITAPSNVAEIAFVDFYFINDDPSEDSLIIRTNTGKYFGVHQGEWIAIPALPNGQPIVNFRWWVGIDDRVLVALSTDGSTFLLGNEWRKYSVDPDRLSESKTRSCTGNWLDHPPTKGIVVDSAGITFEYPLAKIERCYVVKSDGEVEHWSRISDSSSHIMTIRILGLLGALLGATLGFVSKFVGKQAKAG